MPVSNDKHHLLRTFCTVVHFGSFSKAATFLRLPKSSVSKNIRHLEEQLKTQLIIRTTRSMKLTDAGALYYEKGNKILKQVDALEQEVHALTGNSEGKLRISLPLMIGESLLSPLLAEFVRTNSDIQLELDFSHRPMDLIEQDFDIAFRTSSSLPDSSLFEIKLMTLQRVYVASPGYLEAHGRPTQPSDLSAHHKLLFTADLTEEVSEQVVNRSNKIVSNSYQSLITAAQAGCGIARVYDVLIEKELAQKSLIRVLKHSPQEKRYLSILYRQRGSTSQKIGSFIEFFRNHPTLRRST